ncbi:VrrA/YqfQ family protein [Halobacillus sp. K22]|uniref:VrrA/YqfQ family protein n=1 Tax=Halobacillus sp. K22 TaxID=3457431 RepID=UPI003FCD6AAE
MFPTGQPPFPPMGMFPGPQQYMAPQGMMRSIAPFLNQGARSAGGFPGFGATGFGAPGFGGAGLGTQALGAAGNAAKAGGAGWLGHMQTALKAMQSAAPMVQQYGPMIKNIPAMINMMKIMNEPDEEEGEETGESLETESLTSANYDSSSPSTGSASSPKRRRQGTSQPKLYI